MYWWFHIWRTRSAHRLICQIDWRPQRLRWVLGMDWGMGKEVARDEAIKGKDSREVVEGGEAEGEGEKGIEKEVPQRVQRVMVDNSIEYYYISAYAKRDIPKCQGTTALCPVQNTFFQPTNRPRKERPRTFTLPERALAQQPPPPHPPLSHQPANPPNTPPTTHSRPPPPSTTPPSETTTSNPPPPPT